MSKVKWIVSDFGKRAHIDRICDALTRNKIDHIRATPGAVFRKVEEVSRT